jgi:phenylalanyl-tRNA synthetase beta chain
MKLSLAWIFDHIDADWKKQDANAIFSKFNTSTAEIESFHKFNFNLNNFYLGKITSNSGQTVKLLVPELNKEIELARRQEESDAMYVHLPCPVFMIKKIENTFYWANLVDFGLEQTGLLPAFDVSEKDLAGNWKSIFESEDVILEIDNKSITHRPDMWGHRGFAREIAMLLDLPFKDSDLFLTDKNILYFDEKSRVTDKSPVVIENHSPEACKRFTGLYFKSIENKPCNIFVASRLLKVGQRPINGIIDLTNYIALEWSQPVHAYDTTTIADKKIVVRMAKPGEFIELLDGNRLELTNQDLVIADAKAPMCLAGVRGGAGKSINNSTTSVLFESATFDSGTVRRSALRHKTRTDSSARFEKTLDPNQAPQATQRFLKLLDECKIKFECDSDIVCIGQPVQDSIIEVSHDFLEKRSGVQLQESDVVRPLTKLGFGVAVKKTPETVIYVITVPSYRGTKDIKLKEDILEEVIRCYGFNRIPLNLPVFVRKPFDLTPQTRLRKIKSYLVGGAKMSEQQNYIFFDEDFLAELGLSQANTVNVVNPVSQNNFRLVTSLVPGLLKNIKTNHVHNDSLAIFEFARIWGLDSKTPVEHRSLAGMFFEKHGAVDFYKCKQHIIDLLEAIDLDVKKLEWQTLRQAQDEKPESEWYREYQCAKILYDGKRIGVAGNVNPVLLSKLKIHENNTAFIFELDGDWLLNAPAMLKRYKQIGKFQETYFDLSFLVPLMLLTKEIEAKIYKVKPLIKKVEVIDFFEKADWTDVRSQTFRVWLEHLEKTLEKEEIDQVMQDTIKAIESLGAKLRV